jgi:hypothetical protein
MTRPSAPRSWRRSGVSSTNTTEGETPMRKSAVPAVAAVAVAAALVASNAAMATHALIPSSQTSNTAAAATLSGYANPDPDWSDDHWGTGDLDERTVPPVLGEEHAHGGPKHYDD